MKEKALEFKRFLEDNKAWKTYLDFISSKEMAGAIWHEGSLNGFINHVHPEKWISEAFIYGNSGDDEVIKFWTKLSVKWFNVVNGNKPVQKISDFIFKANGFTIFEKGEVRAELNQASDKLSFFVDIEPSMFYNSPAELDDDIQSEKLEKGLIYLKKLLSELK